MRALCAVALGISGYLAYTALTAQQVVGCGGGEVFDCSHVLNSEFSKVMGIPVSVPAFGLYASMLGLLFFFRNDAPDNILRSGWSVLTVGSVAAGLAAVWFTGIQVFHLEHLCPWCLGAHSCGLILAGVVLWNRPFSRTFTSGLSAISAAGIAGLIAAQMTVEPEENFIVETYDDPVATETTGDEGAEAVAFESPVDFAPPVEFGAPVEFAPPVTEDNLFAPPVIEEPAAAETSPAKDAQRQAKKDKDTPAQATSEPDADSDAALPAVAASTMLITAPQLTGLLVKFLDDKTATETTDTDEPSAADENDGAQTVVAAKPVNRERLVTVAGRKFSLNTRHWPLLGDPDAKYVFVEMFDYTCAHCRRTHKAIDGAFEKYGDDLAIIALPVPIDRACNDAIRSSGHPGACELAKLSVAVWRVSPSKFHEYHDWMFQQTRGYSTAKAKAEELVGKEALTAELALPHAGNYLAKHVELYKRVGSGAVPKIMFPRSTMTGQVSSPSTLVSAIERELGR